jgi:uroporphyrinogen-III synthase
MPFTHILITRPREEAKELAELLAPSGVEVIVFPAYDFHITRLFEDQLGHMTEAVAGMDRPLLVFTSTRSVEFGLDQIPVDVLRRCEVASIGPTTARLLQQAGVQVSVQPRKGYSSEDLLDSLAENKNISPGQAFILTAPGGRTRLRQGLEDQGYDPRMFMVYERRPALLEEETITAIEEAPTLLAVWTSVNTMNAMHQRLPSRCWYRLAQAEWLVISERLVRVGRAFSPSKIHLSNGPTNGDILSMIQSLG